MSFHLRLRRVSAPSFIVALSLARFANLARAQESPGTADAAPAAAPAIDTRAEEPALPAEPTAAPAAPEPGDAGRTDTAARAQVPAQAPAPVLAPVLAPSAAETASKAETQVVASAGQKGFSLASARSNPSFVLKLQGTLQVDGRVYPGESSKDTVLLRRVRPIVAGTVLGLVDFYLMPDFGVGQTVLFDAYLDAHPYRWLRLRVGKFKPPIGLERLQADYDLPVPERALTSNLSPVRDVGAQLWGELSGGTLVYALAVLDGAPDNGMVDLDGGGGKDLAARLFALPFHDAPELGALGVGIAATTGDTLTSAKAPGLTALKSEGQTTLFSYLAPATDPMGTGTVFAAGRHTRVNPELYYYYGGFGVLAEGIWSRQRVALAGSRAALDAKGGHVTLSYVIGGENGYGGATPDSAWRPEQGHFGAVEIAARVSRLEFDDRAFPTFASATASARAATGLSLGTTWVLSRPVRVSLSYTHTIYEGGAGTGKAVQDRKPENLVLSRAQLNF